MFKIFGYFLSTASFSFALEGSQARSFSFTSVLHLRFFVRFFERISQKDKWLFSVIEELIIKKESYYENL
ncbi:MAG: hypothetical protein Q7J16_08510 [Candidatus Cloacimonadales bacterium]|nr:hypothetical protein [Candidatus Cloacimonadales bacterium]